MFFVEDFAMLMCGEGRKKRREEESGVKMEQSERRREGGGRKDSWEGMLNSV